MNPDGKTQLCGVIADPVAHSMSPAMHNANFASLRLNFAYVAMRVNPEKLELAVHGLRALNFRGFNVSVPHKQTILTHLDALDDFAKNCQAVNTVVHDDGKLTGYNTDGSGALNAAKEAGANLSRCVVLGAGGAGHAVAYALAMHGADVSILNRTFGKAEYLAEKIKGEGFSATAVPIEKINFVLKDATFLAQTTRVGMNEDVSMVPQTALHSGLTVLDAVYAPLETVLIRQASEVGCKTITGERMLLHQAVMANELWTGIKADAKAMENALYRALGKKIQNEIHTKNL